MTRFENLKKRKFIYLFVFAFTSLATFLIIALPLASRAASYIFSVGDVSDHDILAPETISYTSSYLTEQEKIAVESQIGKIYYPVDPGISRKQVERLKSALGFMAIIRVDEYSTFGQKAEDIGLLNDINLKNEGVEKILRLNTIQWEEVQSESLGVLEEVMKNAVRDHDVDEYIRSVPSLITFSFPQENVEIITNLVTPFIIPNSLYNQDATRDAIMKARDSVKPVVRSFAAGESIVRRGQIITSATMEVLQQYNLVTPAKKNLDYISTSFLVATQVLFIYLYTRQRKIVEALEPHEMILVSLAVLTFLLAARIIIPDRVVIPYLFPLAAFGLTISSLFSIEIGLTFSLSLGILASYNLPNSLVLTMYYVIPGLCGILALGRGRRIINFFWAGAIIGLVGSAVILSLRLNETGLDAVGLFTLVGASLLNGLASASLALLLQYFFAQLLGMTTPLQLLELSRPDHPLMQFLLNNAPGTYQHSLQVANLAEQASESIGADALLTRVGALYHDVGKAKNPNYFIENQIPGNENPHDSLDPVVSAEIIIKHVTDGMQLARKYRLPKKVQDFIREHHGTLITRFQYSRALSSSNDNLNKIDIGLFQYPGPIPGSRETAILMLADGCEARARADLPRSEDDLKKLVHEVVGYYQKEGQFSQTALTLANINSISESFIKTLINIYHPRIHYPDINLK